MKPGEFRAHCRLVETRWVTRDELPAEVRHAFAGLASPIEYPISDAEITERNEWKRIADLHPYSAEHHGYRHEVACDFGETTDREAFEQHMAEAHGRKMRMIFWREQSTQPLARRARGSSKSPKTPAEGRPFKATTKAVAERVRACAECGLVAEVDGSHGSEQWWREHLSMCVGAVSA